MPRKRNKNDAAPLALCAGMHTAIEFLSKLRKALERNGGGPLLLWFMTLDKSAEKLEELAKFAVAQHYPVPRSLIEELAAADCLRVDGPEHVENDRRFALDRSYPERNFGIPLTRFGEEHETLPPKELEDQILGKPLPYPIVVEYEGEPHLVLSLIGGEDEDGDLAPGMVLTSSPLYALAIAPLKFFDLEH